MAIVIEDPALEARLRQAAAQKGLTPEALAAIALRDSDALADQSIVAVLSQRLAKYRNTPPFTKAEADDLFEPLG